jgi:hypothetical protein
MDLARPCFSIEARLMMGDSCAAPVSRCDSAMVMLPMSPVPVLHVENSPPSHDHGHPAPTLLLLLISISLLVDRERLKSLKFRNLACWNLKCFLPQRE